jgi:hypothetical protein
MESSLHRDLKRLYAADDAQEVWVEGFRIDAVQGGRRPRLVEIQSAPLGALRDKVRTLLAAGRRVLIVKPLAARKRLETLDGPAGDVVSVRYSPLRENVWHVFVELVNFVTVWPHPRLTLEVLLTEQLERRVPKRTWRRKKFRVADRSLVAVLDRRELRTVSDLTALLPPELPSPFTTADLAAAAGIPRWLAQKAAYCLSKTGGIEVVGKQRNSICYALPRRQRKAS